MIVDTQYRHALIPLFALISQKYGKKWARIARDVLPYRGRVSLRSRWTFLQVDLVHMVSTPRYDVFVGGTLCVRSVLAKVSELQMANITLVDRDASLETCIMSSYDAEPLPVCVHASLLSFGPYCFLQ